MEHYMEEVAQALRTVVKELFALDMDVQVTRPEPQFGDYATNVAMQLAGKIGKPPREIAQAIQQGLVDYKVDIAGPGFLNIALNDKTVYSLALQAIELPQPLKGKVIVAEYSDPNPFKVLHAGHLYTSIVGDAVANVLQAAGATVHRVNFGGDVGLHSAKAMYGILQDLDGEHPDALAAIQQADRSTWISRCYVAGNNAYEQDETAKAAIVAINKRIYTLHKEADRTSDFAKIYWETRQWSYDYFDAFYADIGVSFEKYYPESVTAPLGELKVDELAKQGVLEVSNGALVFKGEQYGLHTRVFKTANGLPTYEAKDVGLAIAKEQDYHQDQSVIITGNDIIEYMKVVLKVIESFAPDTARNTRHLTHGMVKLQGGLKMSSRKGNFLRARDVLDEASAAQTELQGSASPQVSLAAVKYAFLKQRIGGDIIYDPKESVALQGNSGPYLQYAYARVCSILHKANQADQSATDATSDVTNQSQPDQQAYDHNERALAVKVGEFPEVIQKVLYEYMPHHICVYLYELTQAFNRFYEQERVLGSDRQNWRLQLLAQYKQVLLMGLQLLGIEAPEKM